MTATTQAGTVASAELRSRRAVIKRALARSECNVLELLCDPPWYITGMRLLDLLQACPGIGERTLRRLNFAAAAECVNLLAPVGELTDRQRDWLIERLPRLQCYRAPSRITTTT